MEAPRAPLAVVFVLTACVAVSAANAFAQWFNVLLLTITPLLSVVEAGISFQVVAGLTTAVRRRFRIAEILGLAIVANVGHLVALGWTTARAELAEWPVASFQAETFAVAGAMYVAWRATTTSLRSMRSIDKGIEPWNKEVDRPTTPYSRLWGWFLGGGMALLAFEGVATIGWDGILDLERDLARGVLVATLVYFPVGLSALGRVRLRAGRAHWSKGKIPVIGNLQSRWNAVLAVSMISVLLLTAMVPIGGSSLVLRALAAVVTWAQRALSTLFGGSPGAGRQVVPPTIPAGQPDSGALPSADGVPRIFNWDWQIPRAVWIGLFWAAVAAAIVYVAWTFLGLRQVVASFFRRTGEEPIALGTLRAWFVGFAQALVRLLRGLFRFAETAREVVQSRIAARAHRKGVVGELEPRAVGPPPAGSPQRRIGDLYKHFLDEAGTLVTPRQPSETPDEYRRDVELVVPAAGPDLSELTEVFNEARYSLHVIGNDHVDKAAAAVRQLGTLLTAHASRTEREPEIGDSG